MPFTPPLPFPDEGAANHIRFCQAFGEKGVHLYVYGVEKADHFPARQSKEACETIARVHGGVAIFAQQNPALIDKGVFHNDVISCGNQDLFLYHKEAFVNTPEVIEEIQRYVPIEPIAVEISVEKAIETYLFNSQLLTLPDQSRLLLAPEECRELPLHKLPFPVDFVEIKESMQNGGGPACLRLAIPLTETEINKIHQPIFLTPSLYKELKGWIEIHYRDHLAPEDLGDPALLQESQKALEALYNILQIPLRIS